MWVKTNETKCSRVRSVLYAIVSSKSHVFRRLRKDRSDGASLTAGDGQAEEGALDGMGTVQNQDVYVLNGFEGSKFPTLR